MLNKCFSAVDFWPPSFEQPRRRPPVCLACLMDASHQAFDPFGLRAREGMAKLEKPPFFVSQTTSAPVVQCVVADASDGGCILECCPLSNRLDDSGCFLLVELGWTCHVAVFCEWFYVTGTTCMGDGGPSGESNFDHENGVAKCSADELAVIRCQ
jgi:hypothetical protein